MIVTFKDIKVLSSLSGFLPVMQILAPIPEHSAATTFPIPEDAPVTNTVFPVNVTGLCIFIF
jgi:hypothetical protein